MLGALRHTVVKEFLVLLRDPASRALIFLMPVIQLMVFAFAATLEVRNVTVAVFNEDTGHSAREFVQRVAAASFIDEVVPVHSLNAVEGLIDVRQVLLAIHFPPDFSRKLSAGEPGVVQVLVDGRRANAGQITFSYLQQIASGLEIEMLSSVTGPVAPEVVVRAWYNPNLQYRWFIVPALVATLAFVPAISISLLSVARDRELGTLDQLVVAPISTFEIVLGKALPPVFAGMVASFMVLVLARFFFGVPFTGSLPILFFSLLMFVFACSGFGLAISACCSTQQQALMSMFTLTVPLFITSGFVTPVENMPQFLQYLSQLNPLKHVMVAIHGSFLRSMTLAEAWGNIGPLLLMGVVTMAAAGAIMRWRIQ